MPVYNRVVDMEITSLLFHIASLQKYEMYMQMISSSYVDSARNKMAEDFLKTDFEWIYFWDTDVVIRDPLFLDKMMETAKNMDAPIVCLPYAKKGNSGEYVTCKRVGETLVNHKVGELGEPEFVLAASTGAMLIHRSVLEEMEKPFFQINYLEGGREVPEDYYFTFKATKLGYGVALETRVDTFHFGQASWNHIYNPKLKKNEEKKDAKKSGKKKFKKDEERKKINFHF